MLVPRISLIPSYRRLSFKFSRRQFPVILSYTVTINMSQGQILSNIGLLLKKPVFLHGQLYVTVSRVSSPKGLKVLVCNENGEYGSSTTNIVYKYVLNNL